MLREVEGARQAKVVCREYGMLPNVTDDNWKTEYGGMGIADIRKLKERSDEDRRLKQIYVW